MRVAPAPAGEGERLLNDKWGPAPGTVFAGVVALGAKAVGHLEIVHYLIGRAPAALLECGRHDQVMVLITSRAARPLRPLGADRLPHGISGSLLTTLCSRMLPEPSWL